MRIRVEREAEPPPRVGARPRQRSIMPRWKKKDASRVPSRSERFEQPSASSQRPVRASAHASTSSPDATAAPLRSLPRQLERLPQPDAVIGLDDRHLRVDVHAARAAAVAAARSPARDPRAAERRPAASSASASPTTYSGSGRRVTTAR